MDFICGFFIVMFILGLGILIGFLIGKEFNKTKPGLKNSVKANLKSISNMGIDNAVDLAEDFIRSKMKK